MLQALDFFRIGFLHKTLLLPEYANLLPLRTKRLCLTDSRQVRPEATDENRRPHLTERDTIAGFGNHSGVAGCQRDGAYVNPLTRRFEGRDKGREWLKSASAQLVHNDCGN